VPEALAPLRDRDFRLYFGGEALSMVGSGLHLVALGWYLLDRTGSATYVALVWTAGLGAGLFALPLTGPLADRYPRRLLCVAADLARLVLVGALAAIVFAGTPPLWAIYALTFLIGIGHNVFWPSITALLQEIIRRDQLVNASGLVEVTFQVGNLTGGALGGALLVAIGLGWVLAIDAATYAVSALALLAMHHRPAPREHHDPFPVMVRDGMAYLNRNRTVAGFGVVSVLPWVATICLNVVAVAYVLQVLHRDATVYGLGDMTYGVGALISGFLAALLVAWLGEWTAMVGVLAALAAAYLALATGPATLLAFFGLALVAGFCSSGFRVITNSVLLRVVPNDVMGRTSATIFLVSILLQVVATLAVGPLVNAAGARGGFLMLAAIAVVAMTGLAAVARGMHALPAAAGEGG
jgi:MFS family permease